MSQTSKGSAGRFHLATTTGQTGQSRDRGPAFFKTVSMQLFDCRLAALIDRASSWNRERWNSFV